MARRAAGYKEPDTFVLEHGYCRSVYIKDPNGMLLEFTLDAPNADQIARDRKADAHATLKRWLRGDHTSNNMYHFLGDSLRDQLLSEPPN